MEQQPKLESEDLVAIVNEITDGLLFRRLQDKSRSYLKVDFDVSLGEQFFSVRVTKCNCGHPDLRFLLSFAMRRQLRTLQLPDNTCLAILEKKSHDQQQVQKLVCNRITSLTLLGDDSSDQAQIEFPSVKCYISIKLLFLVRNEEYDKFASLLLCRIVQLEQIHPNVKFVIRKGKEHVYRNHVRMDDAILSCKLLTTACTSIFENSQNEEFRRELMSILGIKKPSKFEKTVGCLLLSQANRNFYVQPKKSAGKHCREAKADHCTEACREIENFGETETFAETETFLETGTFRETDIFKETDSFRESELLGEIEISEKTDNHVDTNICERTKNLEEIEIFKETENNDDTNI